MLENDKDPTDDRKKIGDCVTERTTNPGIEIGFIT
jgi:hypothetical protein